MLIIPAIDLKDGKCVRLRQGNMNKATVFSENPVDIAKKWIDQGCRRLHLVDLDGAFAGRPVNHKIIYEIAKALPDISIQVGGGIRTSDKVQRYFDCGVDYVILGSKVIHDADFVKAICYEFPNKIIIGLDAKNGLVATDGWANISDSNVIDVAKSFQRHGVASIIYTDIDKDGMMGGCNVEATLKLADSIDIPVIASGGIHTLEDIEKLLHLRSSKIEGVITGRAIYEGTLNLSEAQEFCDRFL